MSFSTMLIEKADPYFELQTQKPFLQGILQGTLPIEKFMYWVRVDYPYLVNFSRILALGVAKAESFADMKIMQNYLDWIINEEMALHESYAADNGISKEELELQRMGPTKYAYTRHELSSAYSGSMGELIAGILACIVGYQIVCNKLVKDSKIDSTNPYKDWLKMYVSDDDLDFHTKNIIGMFDRIASESSISVRDSMDEKFMSGVRYETMCWDAYYEMEEWI